MAWLASAALLSVLLTAILWRWAVPRAAAVCLAFATTGAFLAGRSTAAASPWPELPRHATIVTGRVDLAEPLPEGLRVTLAAPSLDGAPPLARALRIRLRPRDSLAPVTGDVLRVRALIRPPQPPDYPGGWDTQREAFFAGLGGYGFAIGPASLAAPARHHFWSNVRQSLAGRLQAGLPGAPGAIAAAMLTGLGTAIPPADRAAFSDSGLAHLLAVAGLHVGTVMALVFAATRLGLAAFEYAALHWPTRRIAAVAALGAGAGYLALTGAHTPLLRSFAMACLVTLGVLTGRHAVSVRGLGVAACALMLLSPSTVTTVSFQMSFASVLVLVAGYEIAQPALARLGAGQWWRGPAIYAAGLVLTSLLAGTAALPYAAYHFGRATLYYVPANMLAVPLTAFWILPWGLGALLLMPLGLEKLALAPMGLGLRGLLAIAHQVAGWPDAALPVPQLPVTALLLISAGLVWGGLWRGPLRLAGLLPVAVAGVLWLLTPVPDALLSADGRLIALRLGRQILVDRASGVTMFEAAAPSRVWGIDARPMEGAPGVRCDAGLCRAAVAGTPVQLVTGDGRPACESGLILAHAALHEPCPQALVLDRLAAARDGSATVRVTRSGAAVVTDRALRGNRPWVFYDRPALPMAPTE